MPSEDETPQNPWTAEGEHPPPAPAPEFLQGRLHPYTLLFALVHTVRGVLIPLIFVLVVGNPTFAVAYLALFGALPALFSLVRYFTFRYRIEGGELITEQGIWQRTERHVPLTRVQDVRLEQGVLHRLLRVVDVHVETAGGGQGAEASLSVLSQAEADRLRSAVFTGAGVLAAEAPVEADASPPRADAERIVRQVPLRDLVLAGLASNHLASSLALVFGLWAFIEEFLPDDFYERHFRTVFRVAIRWWQQGAETAWIVGIAVFVLLLLIGILISVAGNVMLFYGFRLSLRGEDLHRAYGLFTRRSSSLPRRRIQVLKIEESLPRRLAGLATLRADTAGSAAVAASGEGTSGRDVLLPVVPRAEVEPLLPAFFPQIDQEPSDWRRVSPRAIRRGAGPGTLLCLLLSGGLFLFRRDAAALAPLALLPLIWYANVLAYRYLGYALGPGYLRTRRGVLGRALHIVPIRNVQAIVVHQSPFDRRHRVARLLIDTAGQTHTGGGPEIGNVPAEDALSLARTLAREAGRVRYRW